MKNATRVRLFLVLVLLGVLAGVFATPAAQVAVAAPPCDLCETRFDNCLNQTCCGTCTPCQQCQGNLNCCESLVAGCFASCI